MNMGQGGSTAHATLLCHPRLAQGSAVLPARAESSMFLSFIPCTKGTCPFPLSSSPTHDLLWRPAIPHH